MHNKLKVKAQPSTRIYQIQSNIEKNNMAVTWTGNSTTPELPPNQVDRPWVNNQSCTCVWRTPVHWRTQTYEANIPITGDLPTAPCHRKYACSVQPPNLWNYIHGFFCFTPVLHIKGIRYKSGVVKLQNGQHYLLRQAGSHVLARSLNGELSTSPVGLGGSR